MQRKSSSPNSDCQVVGQVVGQSAGQTKIGRPRKSPAAIRQNAFSIRLTSDEKATITQAISRSGKGQTEWLRDALFAYVRPPYPTKPIREKTGPLNARERKALKN